MLLTKEVAAVSFLIAVLNAISATSHPGIIRERHIIHAPIKFKYIHHYNIKKVPIVIKKHLHYYKPYEDESSQEENHSNQIYGKFEFQQPPKYKISLQHSHHDAHEIDGEEEEEEYNEHEQSQEEHEYEDYE